MDIPTLAAKVTAALVSVRPRHYQATVRGEGTMIGNQH